MRFRARTVVGAGTILVVLVCAGLFALQRYRYRLVKSDADLLRLLPGTETSLFFADFRVLRAGGYLRLVQGAQHMQDPEYAAFVRETGFDYTRDIDAVAGSAAWPEVYFVVRGRYAWARVARYAERHGGSCQDSVCRLPGSRAGKWTSFTAIQPDVLGVAASAGQDAAATLRKQRAAVVLPSTAPVWIRFGGAALDLVNGLPPMLRVFAEPLRTADSAVLSLAAADEPTAAFELELAAHFGSREAAGAARSRLEQTSKLLGAELARQPGRDPRGLPEFLRSGTFRSAQADLTAGWPVPKQLLQGLE